MTSFSVSKSLIFSHQTTCYYASAAAVKSLAPSFIHLLQLSIDHHSLHLTKQSHALVHHIGLTQSPIVVTKLISAYSACKNSVASRAVFDSVLVKNVYIWNTLINGCAKNLLYDDCFDTFNQMCITTVQPDEFTLSTLSKVSGDVGDSLVGESVHGKCLRLGFISDTVVANSIMTVYCKRGRCGDARKVFDEMPQRNVSSWNTVIAGYAGSIDPNFEIDVYEFIRDMQIDGLKPDAYTVSTLLPLCGGSNYNYGRELHCYAVKNGLELGSGSDVHLGCCLIDMYSKTNKINVGRLIFDRLKNRNIFTWTAMINGCVQNRAFDEAMILFREMQWSYGIEPNKVSLISILPTCIALSGLMGARQIHGYAIRKQVNQEISLINAFIDTYSKCGSLNYARRVFDSNSITKDAISWSSIISGYGLHGKGQEAIFLYEKMLQLGITPDTITILGVLSACGRSGLVKEGLNIYNSFLNDYKKNPSLEICGCMVDMFARSGKLDQAMDFVKNMPMAPGPSIWGAIVNASVLHGNAEMRDLAYKFLIQIEPENAANYISLSNLYASSKEWDSVAEVRTMMKNRGLKKFPGLSWISINSKTHSFYVADKSHPCADLIYQMLDELILAMKGVDYSTDFE